MFLDFVEHFATRQIKYLDDFGRPSDYKKGLIGGQVGSQDGIVFVTKREDAPAGLEIPCRDFPTLSSSSTPGYQAFAVPAENE